MIELSNSKRTYLGKTPDGRDRWALDVSIGAIQMREPGGEWQDIKPQVVRDTEGWHVEGAPYGLEVLADGTRRVYPDRLDKSKWLYLPAVDLFRKLTKRIEGNKIICSAQKFDVIFQFTNTGVQFMVLIKEPVTFDRITLDMDSAGLDILQLLKAKAGLGIPRPRLMEADPTLAEPQERWLDWSLKAGQLELGFDLTGLCFPVLLKNTTIDKQVAASTDDVSIRRSTSLSSLTLTSQYCGDYDATWYDYEVGMRFLAVPVPNAAIIGANSYLILKASGLAGSITATLISGQDADDCVTFSTFANYDARPRTATIGWTPPAWVTDTPYNTASIAAPLQTIVDRVGWVSGKNMAFFWTHALGWGGVQNRMACYSWDYGDNTHGPKLYIEYGEEPLPGRAVLVIG